VCVCVKEGHSHRHARAQGTAVNNDGGSDAHRGCQKKDVRGLFSRQRAITGDVHLTPRPYDSSVPHSTHHTHESSVHHAYPETTCSTYNIQHTTHNTQHENGINTRPTSNHVKKKAPMVQNDYFMHDTGGFLWCEQNSKGAHTH
jgi:hypothetical protein